MATPLQPVPSPPVPEALPATGGELVLRSLRLAWWIWLLPAGLAVALALHAVRVLDYVHVLSAILWTGTDLFMGFVIGPVLRRLDLPARRQVLGLLMPRMLFFMPVAAGTTTTAGWYLARWLGVYSAPGLHWWFVGALVLAGLMFVQGLGLLLPLNLRVYWEIQKERPDPAAIRRAMVPYVRLVAWQGVLQVAILVVMVHFVLG